MCIRADIKLFCCGKEEWRAVEGSLPSEPPILFFCPEASFVKAEVEGYDLKSISLRHCASVVRGMPPADCEIKVPAYPDCCGECSAKAGSLKDLRKRALEASKRHCVNAQRCRQKHKEEEENIKTMSVRGDTTKPSPANITWTTYRLADCQDHLWDWASMAFSQLQEGAEECHREALQRFKE